VVIHSYRHRYGYVAGDPAYEELEAQLARQPAITVPTVALYGVDDGVTPLPPAGTGHERLSGPYQRRDVPAAGHNVPQEKPGVFAEAVMDLLRS
jgi:pimeloyl-ACP methyl ester carboxylesterase